MSFQKFIQNRRNLLFTSFIVIVLTVTALAGSFIGINYFFQEEAFAHYNREVSPGESFEITFWYGNEAGRDEGDSIANIEIWLGTTLEIQRIYEVFDTTGDGNHENEQKFELCQDFLRPVPLTNPLRRRMFYLPRSANDPNNCSGTTLANGNEYGPIILPQGNFSTRTNFGKIVFEVKLREDILDIMNLAATSDDGTYQVGDLLNTDNFQGGFVRFKAGVLGRESDIVPSEGFYTIKIGEPLEAEDEYLTHENMDRAIENLSCTPEIITPNGSITCEGSLAEGYRAPEENLELSLEDGGSRVCEFRESGFTCSDIIAGPSEGVKNIRARVGDRIPQNTGETVLVQASKVPITQENLVNGGLIAGQDFATATNLNCGDAIAGQETQCTGTLPGNYIAPESGKLKLNIENQDQVECSFVSDTNFFCNNMPVGEESGRKKVQAAIGSETPTDTGRTIEVFPSDDEYEDGIYLIDSSRIIFSPSKDNPAVYGKEDLNLTVIHLNNIQECTIGYRKHGTEDSWQNLTTDINEKTCSTILAKELQDQHRWEFSIYLRDENSHRWRSDPSYFMRLGAISFVEIRAEAI